ncbi:MULTISPECIES: hypothetical protein [unclassified Myroides]|uniref:hypothetical protein n=1 Tax=unclassified Myroides TaxID=2642485 RepID=UPI0008F50AA4|nr:MULTISPECIES: hypothetical protein [unclassified Myroides]APA91925.1 hypothetical protein BK054_06755 [Myroides sp. ZB35]
MQAKKNISRILLVVAIMFTIVFQFMHSFEHIVSSVEYEKEHSTHAHFNESRGDLSDQLTFKEAHSQLDKCFVCDTILNPAITSDVLSVEFITYDVARSVQDIVSLSIIPLSQVFFSLRAPPVSA